MDKAKPDGLQSLLPRFQGKEGDSSLTEVLLRQVLIRGEPSVCDEFKNVVKLVELKPREALIEQGASDSTLYFILSGSLSVVVNGREIASRVPGQHVGEMALIDPTARRSASVFASEPSVVAAVIESDFSAIANKYPQLWRRIAVELSERLKQRNRFLVPPRDQPVVFIGSSSESRAIAEQIQSSFSDDPFVVRIWTQGVFTPSSTPIESLATAVSGCDFGVIVLSPDDVIFSRWRRERGPRDNVVFELGLFIGHLGRERTFYVVPRTKANKIPTDLLGVTPLKYTKGKSQTIASRMAPISDELRAIIKKLGPR
jgi:CRP/FNR family cyclic AMP-dependent transcriptional regulator